MTEQGTRTYRGTSLEEILPQIRAELGDDAVVVGRREHLQGGVGGFFAKRELEVEARPARPRLDVRDDGPAMPGLIPAPEREREPGPAAPATEAPAAEAQHPQQPRDAQGLAEAFAEQLARLTADAPPPPAPAHEPVVSAQVAGAPTLDDVLPEARVDLARLFQAGRPIGAQGEAEDHPAAEDRPPAAEDEPPAPEPPLATPSEALPAAAQLVVSGDAAPEDPLVGALVARGLSPRFARSLRDEAVGTLMPLAPDQSPERVLRDAIARRIPIATPKRGPHGGVVGFVGPGGSGKTRCVARLATAYATRSDLPVACLTLRAKDGGAELERLLADLDVPVHAAEDAAQAAAAIEQLRGHALVVLDTPAVSPRAEAERRTLLHELRQLALDELHVCVPATIAPGPGRELADAARELGADAIALTHADETESLGGAVELAATSGLPLSFVARGTALESGLRAASADDIALALLP